MTFIKENGESVMNQVYDITHDILTGSYCDVLTRVSIFCVVVILWVRLVVDMWSDIS